jgi:hypothetical protein
VTTTARAAAIRAAYKAKGWSARDISVRSESFSMGSAIRVNIKNPAVPFAWAKEIAEGHERIDRCHVSGEILSGCNRYVSVGYSHEAETTIRALYAPALDAAATELATHETNVLLPIGDTGFLLGNGSNGWGFSLWKDSHIRTGTTPTDLATALHTRLAAA